MLYISHLHKRELQCASFIFVDPPEDEACTILLFKSGQNGLPYKDFQLRCGQTFAASKDQILQRLPPKSGGGTRKIKKIYQYSNPGNGPHRDQLYLDEKPVPGGVYHVIWK